MREASTWQTAVFLAIVAAGAWWGRKDVRRLAFVVGIVFPIDLLTGISPEVIDLVRYVGAVAVIVLAKPDLPPEGRNIANQLAALLVALALVRIAFSVLHRDTGAIAYTWVVLPSTAIALLVAQRRVLWRPLVGGWLTGIVLSGFVALMQALDLPTLRAPEYDNSRYPGLSNFTMSLTWQLAYATILCVYVLSISRDRRWLQVGSVAGAVTCVIALLVNGAQGGLLGLACATLATVWVFRRQLTWHQVRIPLLLVGGAAVLGGVVMAIGWLELATLDGIFGGDFANEKARWTVFKAAWREMADSPLVGLGRTEFIDRYTISPHNLALDSGVIGGITGLAAGVAVLVFTVRQWLRGPVDRRPESITAFILLAALLSSFFTETQGPFIGLARVCVMFVAVLTVQGFHPVAATSSGPLRTDDLTPTPAAPSANGAGTSATVPHSGARHGRGTTRLP